MMDGRVGAIRDALDKAGHVNVGILSYCAKYASAFYGPFRDSLESSMPQNNDKNNNHWTIPSNKKSYQQDPRNLKESLRELHADSHEGADFLMVKPAGSYLDVIHKLKQNTSLPIAAYHVSGEYSMLKAASEKKFIDEKDSVMEVLLSMKRAGADLIFTYYAFDAARWLKEEEHGR